MHDYRKTLTIACLLGLVSACGSFYKSHPWGVGGDAWRDSIKATEFQHTPLEQLR